MHTRKITKPLKPRHFTEMFITYLNTQDVQGTRRQQHCREEKMQTLNCVEHRNFEKCKSVAPGRLPPPPRRRRRSRTARASTPPDRCGRHEFFSENSAPNLDHFRCTFWQIQGQWSRTPFKAPGPGPSSWRPAGRGPAHRAQGSGLGPRSSSPARSAGHAVENPGILSGFLPGVCWDFTSLSHAGREPLRLHHDTQCCH